MHSAVRNGVMEKVFEDVRGDRVLSRRVQEELRDACENEDEIRDLLIYLSSTKHLQMMYIDLTIKIVDGALARQLRREESDRAREKRRKTPTGRSLTPGFASS